MYNVNDFKFLVDIVDDVTNNLCNSVKGPGTTVGLGLQRPESASAHMATCFWNQEGGEGAGEEVLGSLFSSQRLRRRRRWLGCVDAESFEGQAWIVDDLKKGKGRS